MVEEKCRMESSIESTGGIRSEESVINWRRCGSTIYKRWQDMWNHGYRLVTMGWRIDKIIGQFCAQKYILYVNCMGDINASTLRPALY